MTKLLEAILTSLLEYKILYSPRIDICYLPDGRAGTEKYFPEASEAAQDRRSRAASEAEGKYFSSTARPKR
jgi:hypothetical protein